MSDINVSSSNQSGGITAGQIATAETTASVHARPTPVPPRGWKVHSTKVLVGATTTIVAGIILTILGLK